jgi:hypothetical protein
LEKGDTARSLKRVKTLSNKPENFDDLHNSKEDLAKLLEVVTEKMKALEDKEGTVEILEALSRRVKFLESKENTIIDTEKGIECTLENSCYTAKYKMGPCPCELYRI